MASLAVLVMASGCGIMGRAPVDVDTDTPEVVTLREAARMATSQLVTALTPTGRDLGTAHLDGCLIGEWSWKFRDSFQHRCGYISGTAVAMPGVPGGLATARRLADANRCVPVGSDPFDAAAQAYRDANGTGTTSPYERDSDLPTGHVTCAGMPVEYLFLNPKRSRPSPLKLPNPFRVMVSEAQFPAPTGGPEQLIIVVQVSQNYYEKGW